jgi:hypothetical protein
MASTAFYDIDEAFVFYSVAIEHQEIEPHEGNKFYGHASHDQKYSHGFDGWCRRLVGCFFAGSRTKEKGCASNVRFSGECSGFRGDAFGPLFYLFDGL